MFSVGRIKVIQMAWRTHSFDAKEPCKQRVDIHDRDPAKRLAERLGVDETQAIHHALHELAVKLLPQYEADEGPLTAVQLRQINKRATKRRAITIG